MIETRELTPNERRWVRDALQMSAPRLTDRESLWALFLGVASGIGIFQLLRESVFHHLMPDRPTLGMALSVVAGSGFAVASTIWLHWLRGKIAHYLAPFRPQLEQDARDGVAAVYTSDNVESWFDPEQAPKIQELVVRFPEGEIRVDKTTCEQEGISEPVSGWCRIARLPRTGQVLDITTKHP